MNIFQLPENESTDVQFNLDTLSRIHFENINCNHRKGAILFHSSDEKIPIVRTTTNYQKPPQRFQKIHHDLVKKIKDTIKQEEQFQDTDFNFNQAMVEIYDDQYKTMGFHSDQALDLDPNSYICIYSCYGDFSGAQWEWGSDKRIRTHVVKDKDKRIEGQLKIPMKHNSFILFSVDTNSNYLHKIILESTGIGKKWLGITFRMSKTFIRFVNEIPYFKHIVLRKPETEEERREFYRLRSQENKSKYFKYPDNYCITINDADLIN